MLHNRWRFSNGKKRKNNMQQKSENEKNAKFYDALISRFTVYDLSSNTEISFVTITYYIFIVPPLHTLYQDNIINISYIYTYIPEAFSNLAKSLFHSGIWPNY